MAQKFFKCPLCKQAGIWTWFGDLAETADHCLKEHKDRFPADRGWTRDRVVYYLRTGRVNGRCCICHKPTEWNEKTGKYYRFCGNPKCKEYYRREFQNRMIGKYGKVSLLNDPNVQRKMLAARKISGVYTWSDRRHQLEYTGSYERAFLQFLDINMNYDAGDIFAPSPHTFYYELHGEKHFYIPDFYIGSLNLQVEIKDDDNMHPKRLTIDAEKEKAKDQIFMSTEKYFNYLKIRGTDFKPFLYCLKCMKSHEYFDDGKNVVML